MQVQEGLGSIKKKKEQNKQTLFILGILWPAEYLSGQPSDVKTNARVGFKK